MTVLSPPAALYRSEIKSLTLLHSGKVRDIYAIDDRHMLIVTSDRLSAFDVILPDPVPGKGEILNSISLFWFDKTRHIIANHLADLALEDVLPDAEERAQVEGRAMVVRRLKALPIEAVIRGYLIGSGWKDYQATGEVCGIALPANLVLAQKLPQALYTPSSKAAVGEHDENISFAETAKLVGAEMAAKVRDTALALYQYAADYAANRGIIIADTKFEFGVDEDGNLILIDEALTPDSSRFWPAASYREGSSPPSFDKQFVRDYLETLAWDKRPPGPHLPDEILTKTSNKYREALRLLTH